MNLKKLFNTHYMKQNLKKSKALLVFFLGIIPLLSIIIFLLEAKFMMPVAIDLQKISIPHLVGIYIIPIILSVSLFGFVYKRKSVNSMISMPLSRKTIFITNTITGILLLLGMVFCSGVGIYIASIFTPIILPFPMLIDYLCIWTVTYLFVFILSNLALSISGNRAAHLVVVTLLLFFLPFMNDYLFEYDKVVSNSVTTIEIHENKTKVSPEYQVDNHENRDYSYSVPYRNLRNGMMGGVSGVWNVMSIFKMIGISIIGFILGLFLFRKRKMEQNETTFASLKIHNFVKALTMIPIGAIIYHIFGGVTIMNVTIMVALLIYFFLYDFITKKAISFTGKNLLHLAFTMVVIMGTILVTDNLSNHHWIHKYISIEEKDITGYQLRLENDDMDEFNYVYITKQENIDRVTDCLKEKAQNNYLPTSMIIETKNQKYKIFTTLNRESYDKMIEELKVTAQEEIQNTKTLADSNHIYAISYRDHDFKTMSSNKKLLEQAKKAIKNPTSCKEYGWVSVHAYRNGKSYDTMVKACNSKELISFIENAHRLENKKLIKEIQNKSYEQAIKKLAIVDITFTDGDRNFYPVADSKPIYGLIKKYGKDDFNIHQEYLVIYIAHDGGDFSYYSNRVEEFKRVLEGEENAN